MSKRPILSTILFGFTGLFVLFAMSVLAQKSDKVAIVFSPGTSPDSAFTRIVNSGGQIVRTGRFDNLVIATFNNYSVQQIKNKTGAWLVLDATLAAACF